MKLVFTSTTTPLSKAIRWASGGDCSHFLLVFESPAGGLAFESNLLGTHPKFWRTDLETLTVVTQFDLPLSTADEDHLWDVIVDQYDGKEYDYPGFVYFAWRALLFKLFKKPMPKVNLLEQSGSYLCVAVLNAVMPNLPPDLQKALQDVDVEMRYPNELRDIMRPYLKEIT